jgi:hypothetical protein
VARKAEIAGVHVGVLAAVVRQHPIGRCLVGVQARRGLPEALLGGIKGFAQPASRFRHPGFQSPRIGQHHKRHAVAVPRAVQHRGAAALPVDEPGVPARGGVEKRGAQERERVSHPLLVPRLARRAVKHGMRDDKARGADQVAGVRVVDRAVVQEEVVHAATGVGGHGIVKRHGFAQVLAQEVGGAEVRQGRSHGGYLLERSG